MATFLEFPGPEGVQLGSKVIPEITHELGKHWEQPHRDMMMINDTEVYMRLGTFESLKDYSRSQPSGVYEGKMWKSQVYIDNDTVLTWILRWFGTSEDPNMCSNHWRRIILVYDKQTIHKSFFRIK